MTRRSSAAAGHLAVVLLIVSAVAARGQVALFGAYWENVARAAAQGDPRQVQELLASGKSPNDTDNEEHTALHVAAMNGNLQIAAIMIKAKAKLDPQDKLGHTPLHYAADRNHADVAKLLLDVGVAVDPENRNGVTPLMLAASRGNLDVIRVLLDKGANPTKTDFTGRDAIGWAADSHRPAVIQALKRAANNKRS